MEKQADGRLLHVYFKDGGAPRNAPRQPRSQPQAVGPEEPEDEVMMVDDAPVLDGPDPREGRLQREAHARSERDERDFRNEYPREPRRAEPAFQDGRYGFGNSRPGPRYGGRDDRQDHYRDGGRGGRGGRMYSDNMLRRDGVPSGPSYRR